MSRVAEAYKRWRHTRGYGVHSPFAFRIVSRVVRLPRGYCYYRESALSALEPKEQTDARLLFRLTAELDIRSVSFSRGFSKEFINAVRGFRSDMIASATGVFPPDTQLILGHSSQISADACFGALESRDLKAIWIKSATKALAEELFNALSEGVMFRGGESILLIPHRGMQKVAYTVCI